MPPYHSWPTVTHVHFPTQLEHKECPEEGSATHKGFLFGHSCTSSNKNISTWAVFRKDVTAVFVCKASRHRLL